MDVHRMKLLAALGDLFFAEEPTDETGSKAPEGESSEKEASGDGDQGSKDDETDDSDDSDGFKPITSEDEFNRILGKRLHRERAKFADYDDLKQKVVDLEAANAKLSEDLSKESHRSLVSRIAKETEVDEEILSGSTEEELRASAKRFNDRLAAAVEAKLEAAGGSGIPGRSPYTGTGDERPREANTQTGRERARARAK